MVYTISLAEKPVPHISEADWKSKIWNMRAVAQTKTSNSYDLRNDVRQTRNEAVIMRRWANYHNNVKLCDRLTEMRRYLNRLGGVLQNLKLQSELLLQEKFKTEKELEKYYTCLNVLGECRLLRDTKNKLNLVNDNVGNEMLLEINSLEATKKLLSEKCMSAWEQNNRVVELIYKLESDMEDKKEAVEIDMEALNLDSTSMTATYKPDILRLSYLGIPFETWKEKVELNLVAADNECQTATKLREGMVLTREKRKLDYLTQYEATNYALRRRSYETIRLKTELEFQQKNILDEMKKLDTELDRTNKCKEETINYLKCAESRLEARNQRPAMECTKDEPQMGLCEEVVLLRSKIDEMLKRIAETKSTYNQMEGYLLEVEKEIKYQEQSIKLDDEALALHESLIKMIPISQIDRNIELLNLAAEMPPEKPVVH